MTPLVTIVTPSWNQGRYIEATLRSVAEQRKTYPAIEHIVVDGGSTDETVDVLRRYPGEVRWVSETDLGFADAVNKGLAMAHGDIIGIQSSDDVYEPGAVRHAMDAFELNPRMDLLYGGYRYADESGNAVGDPIVVPAFDLGKLMRMEAVVPQNSAFFRRSIVERTGPLDLECDFVADLEFWLRMAMNNQVITIPQCLSRVRIHKEQRNARSARFGADWSRALEKNRIRAKVSAREWKEIDAAAALFTALYEARSGSAAAAIGETLRAVWLSPRYTVLRRAGSLRGIAGTLARRLNA